jgi:hypothetical protein
MFISDEVLLFSASSASFSNSAIWRHRPGTSEASQLYEGDLGTGGCEVSPDRSGFLLARFPGTSSRAGDLSFASVVDDSLVLLAKDLEDYRMYESMVKGFAIAPTSRRAIYVASLATDAGAIKGVASVSLSGTDRVLLATSNDRTTVSPYGDRVAVTAFSSTSAAYPAAVISASTGAVQFRIENMATLRIFGFVPGDRGVVFTDKATAGTNWRLRHLSFATGAFTALAEWGTNTLAPYGVTSGIETKAYPVDPTGCFVPVDSDLDPAGTRLVLLPE